MPVEIEIYRKPKDKQRSDFESIDYLHSNRSEVEFQKDLDTLLREYMRLPSAYVAYLTPSGDLTDQDGVNKLTEMAEAAVNKRIGQRGYERTWAETAGVYALQALYGSSTDEDLVVLASPPGLPEEGFGRERGERMSMTGISLINLQADGRRKITTYTVPILEITPVQHVEMLKSVVDNGVFETTVGVDLGAHPDRKLVSRPIKVVAGRVNGASDRLARELGFESFPELESRTREGLKLLNDERAEGRRIGLTSYIAKQLISYRNKRNEDGLRIAGKVVRVMFALEASGEYLNQDVWQAIGKFKEIVNGFRTKEIVEQMKDEERVLYERENSDQFNVLQQIFRMINNNSQAQSLLMASSCGGGGAWEDIFDNKWIDNRDFGTQNIMQDIMEKKESEDYSFDHEGECVVCKVDPKKLGPCNICKDCDHKIQQQAG